MREEHPLARVRHVAALQRLRAANDRRPRGLKRLLGCFWLRAAYVRPWTTGAGCAPPPGPTNLAPAPRAILHHPPP
eukprot:9348762-Lingulodinium_polyedra.AAC.1